MQIKIRDSKTYNECIINPVRNIGQREQLLIKSLCYLQMMCMNSEVDKDKFDTFCSIIENATEEVEQLFCEEKRIEDGTEQFKF